MVVYHGSSSIIPSATRVGYTGPTGPEGPSGATGAIGTLFGGGPSGATGVYVITGEVIAGSTALTLYLSNNQTVDVYGLEGASGPTGNATAVNVDGVSILSDFENSTSGTTFNFKGISADGTLRVYLSDDNLAIEIEGSSGAAGGYIGRPLTEPLVANKLTYLIGGSTADTTGLGFDHFGNVDFGNTYAYDPQETMKTIGPVEEGVFVGITSGIPCVEGDCVDDGIELELRHNSLYKITTPIGIKGFTGDFNGNELFTFTAIIDGNELWKMPSNVFFERQEGFLSCGLNIVNFMSPDAGSTWLATISSRGYLVDSCEIATGVGSCCYIDDDNEAFCEDYVTENYCETKQASTFNAFASCAENCGQSRGICCIEGECIEGLGPSECDYYAGTYWPCDGGGDGGGGGGGGGEGDLGACCVTSQTESNCSDQTYDDCVMMEGNWASSFLCESAPMDWCSSLLAGACCNTVEGTCYGDDLTFYQCLGEDDSEWFVGGSCDACDPNVTGLCCVQDTSTGDDDGWCIDDITHDICFGEPAPGQPNVIGVGFYPNVSCTDTIDGHGYCSYYHFGGACCNYNGQANNCTWKSNQTACESGFGTWIGAGSRCPLPATEGYGFCGACCDYDNDTCEDFTLPVEFGGSCPEGSFNSNKYCYQFECVEPIPCTQNSDCPYCCIDGVCANEVVCSDRCGACCIGTECATTMCDDASTDYDGQGACDEFGGLFGGYGTSCSDPNPCGRSIRGADGDCNCSDLPENFCCDPCDCEKQPMGPGCGACCVEQDGGELQCVTPEYGCYSKLQCEVHLGGSWTPGITCGVMNCCEEQEYMGACCEPGGDCNYVSIQQCYCDGTYDLTTKECIDGTNYWPDDTANAPNIFRGVGVECEEGVCDCTNVERACCILDEVTQAYSCEDLTPQQCSDFGGDHYPQSMCIDGNVCPGPLDPKGACCLCNGTCLFTTEASCENIYSGVYQGDAIECSSVDCSTVSFGPIGACCYSTGDCDENLYECQCEGVRWTEGTCEDFDPPCTPLVGSCCIVNDDGIPTGECNDNNGQGVFENGCLSGVWQEGKLCVDDPCVGSTLARCNAGSVSGTVTQWLFSWTNADGTPAFGNIDEARAWGLQYEYLVDEDMGPPPNWDFDLNASGGVNGWITQNFDQKVGGCILPTSFKIYRDFELSDVENTPEVEFDDIYVPEWDGTSCSKFGARRFLNDNSVIKPPYDRHHDPAKMGNVARYYRPLPFRKTDFGIGINTDITPIDSRDNIGLLNAVQQHNRTMCTGHTRLNLDYYINEERAWSWHDDYDPTSGYGCANPDDLGTVFYHRYATFVPFGQIWGPQVIEEILACGPQECEDWKGNKDDRRYDKIISKTWQASNHSTTPGGGFCIIQRERDEDVCPREFVGLDSDFPSEWYGGGPNGTTTIDTPEDCELAGGYVTNYTLHGNWHDKKRSNYSGRVFMLHDDPRNMVLSNNPYRPITVAGLPGNAFYRNITDDGAYDWPGSKYPQLEHKSIAGTAIAHADYIINYMKGPLYVDHQLGSSSTIPGGKRVYDKSGLKWIHSYPLSPIECTPNRSCFGFEPQEICFSGCCNNRWNTNSWYWWSSYNWQDAGSALPYYDFCDNSTWGGLGCHCEGEQGWRRRCWCSEQACESDSEIGRYCCPDSTEIAAYLGFPLLPSEYEGEGPDGESIWSENAIKGSTRGLSSLGNNCSVPNACRDVNDPVWAPGSAIATCSSSGWMNVCNGHQRNPDALAHSVEDTTWNLNTGAMFHQRGDYDCPHGWSREFDRSPTTGYLNEVGDDGGCGPANAGVNPYRVAYRGNKSAFYCQPKDSSYNGAGSVALPGGRKSATPGDQTLRQVSMYSEDVMNYGTPTGWNSNISIEGQPSHTHRMGHGGFAIATGSPCECCGGEAALGPEGDFNYHASYGPDKPGCMKTSACCFIVINFNTSDGVYSSELFCPPKGSINVDPNNPNAEPWSHDMCDPLGDFDDQACADQYGGTYEDWFGENVFTGVSHCVQYPSWGNSCCWGYGCSVDDWNDWINNSVISMASVNRNRAHDGTISEHISDVNYTLWFFDDK